MAQSDTLPETNEKSLLQVSSLVKEKCYTSSCDDGENYDCLLLT